MIKLPTATAALAVLTGLGALYAFGIHWRPLQVPDEARYVEIPREMLVSGDFVLPRFNEFVYLEKPPLFYWLQALVMSLFGLSEGSVRLVPLASGLGCCGMVYAAGARWFSRKTGVLAALILGTMAIWYVSSRIVTLDLLLACFITATMIAFFEAAHAATPAARRGWLIAMYAAAGLAVMSKGLVGAAIPGIAALIWIAHSRRYNLVKAMLDPFGIAIFVLVVTPWHLLVAGRVPGFLDFYFVQEHLLRFTTDVHRRTGPIWYFVPVVLAGVSMWLGPVLVSLFTLRKGRGGATGSATGFLVVWIVVVFSFFSLSSSKLPGYVLPLFPALAILTAERLRQAMSKPMPADRAGLLLSAATLVALAIFLLAMADSRLFPTELEIPRVIETMGGWRWGLIALLLIAAIVVAVSATIGSVKTAFAALAITSFVGFPIADSVAAKLEIKSTKSVIEKVRPILRADQDLISYRVLFSDAAVYLGRTLKLCGGPGELRYGVTLEGAGDRIMDEAELGRRISAGGDPLILSRRRDFQRLQNAVRRPLFIIGENHWVVLAGIKPPASPQAASQAVEQLQQ